MSDHPEHLDYWRARWADGRTGFHREAVNEHLLRHGDRLAGPRILVPLAGKSLDLLHLRDSGFEVVAIEGAEAAVREFHQEHKIPHTVAQEGPFEVFTSEGLRFLCGDFFAATPEQVGPIESIWDRASLIALPRTARVAYTTKLKELSRGKAALLLVTVEYDQGRLEGPPFSVSEEEVRGHYGDLAEIERLSSKDILDEGPRFRAHGLDAATEVIYHIRIGRP